MGHHLVTSTLWEDLGTHGMEPQFQADEISRPIFTLRFRSPFSETSRIPGAALDTFNGEIWPKPGIWQKPHMEFKEDTKISSIFF